MKRKELRHLIETLWPSHTTAKGTVYDPMTPALFAKLWIAANEAVHEGDESPANENERLWQKVVNFK